MEELQKRHEEIVKADHAVQEDSVSSVSGITMARSSEQVGRSRIPRRAPGPPGSSDRQRLRCRLVGASAASSRRREGQRGRSILDELEHRVQLADPEHFPDRRIHVDRR